MPQFNRVKREIALKIVYYGCGLSGKTTNLVWLHTQYPDTQRGKLVKLDTEQERTLFFDYFPAVLGTVRGFSVRVDYFTVPGQSYYNATRRTVLAGADGVVFVGDSQPDREDANIIAHDNMLENLALMGLDIETIPLVYQWNKRDVEKPLSTKLLEKQLNRRKAPSFEAVATEGTGVRETEREILAQTLKSLQRLTGDGA